MSSAAKHFSLWCGAALVAALDAILFIQILEFIDYSDNVRSGSGRMWVATKIGCIALASILVGGWAIRAYLLARRRMNPLLLFVARLPLLCLFALLLIMWSYK